MKQEKVKNPEVVNVCAKGIVSVNDENIKFVEFLIHKNAAPGVRVPIEVRVVATQPKQGLDSATRKKIRRNLAVLNKSSLYEFLDVGRGISKADLERRYQELYREWS